MAQQAAINPYIVKFLKKSNPPKNKIAGTGFIIAPNHVVTCTHVLWAALGESSDCYIQNCTPAEKSFDATFPLLPQPVTVTLKIIRSNPWNRQADVTSIDDITVLEILDTEFKGDTPRMKALQDEAHRDHLFFAKGFHDSQAEELDGVCESGISNGRIALRITSNPTNLEGASGGPVWDKDEKAIIGMLQSANKSDEAKSNRAYMIPLAKIQQFCEGLDICLKLSTDPIKNQRIPKENGNFKAVLIKKIIRELRHPDAQLLKEALAEELGINEETDEQALSILADELLNRDVDEAIRDYLTVATTDCIHENGLSLPRGWRQDNSNQKNSRRNFRLVGTLQCG